MAYDGIVLKAITNELENTLVNNKIEKIYQPTKESIIMQFRISGERRKLLIDISSQAPRVHFTNGEFENPKTPPPFCMLLRKHLENYKIIDITQISMDRILKIDVLSRDDLAFEVKKSLIVEIMGKYSNIILIDSASNKIIDSIKRVNKSMSSVREILPGLIYNNSDISNRLNPLSDNAFSSLVIDSSSIKKGFIKTFTGLSPLIIREISFRANLDEDRPLNSLSNEEVEKLEDEFNKIMAEVNNNDFSPIIIEDLNKLVDFSALDLKLYSNANKIKQNSISDAVDYFYSKKLSTQIVLDKSSELRKKLKNLIEREENKLQKQLTEFEQSQNREIYKIYGDLISSNLYRIENGLNEIELNNFYDNMNPITVPLDNKISAQANANKYYKKYAKLKNANIKLQTEIETTKQSIEYLKSVLFGLDLSESSDDIDEIRNELFEMHYLKKGSSKKKNDKLKFLEFTTSDGHKVYCGKNNKQNEYLTLKFANNNDLWFHVQNAPGSHVILKINESEFSEQSILEAAQIAAQNSSLKNSNNITVDYTLRKYVKRHPAKILGLVTYTDFNTIIIKNWKLI